MTARTPLLASMVRVTSRDVSWCLPGRAEADADFEMRHPHFLNSFTQKRRDVLAVLEIDGTSPLNRQAPKSYDPGNDLKIA